MTMQSSTVRYHSLDALRAFALLLGIVFHAAESFRPGHFEWAIIDRSTSSVLPVFQHACHSFRLEIFFLIAGFFAHLVYHRRGCYEFILNRIKRILIPLVIGWFILYPILAYLWIAGSLKSHNPGLLNLPPEAFEIPAWKVTLFAIYTGELFKHFDLTHLWFLHQLLWIYVFALLIRYLFSAPIDRNGTWRIRIDRGFRWVMEFHGNTILFAIPTVLILLTMRSWDVDTPRDSLLPHIPTTLLYGFFFMVGWLLHRQDGLLGIFERRWWLHFVVAFLLLYPSLNTGYLLNKAGYEPTVYQIRIVYTVIYAWMMWSWVFGFTGLFMRFCNSHSPAWRYVADSSYFLYIVHIPIVVGLQVMLALVDLHWTIKFTLINLISFTILFWMYHYLARSTIIGAVLNGRKYPFVPLFRKKAAVTVET